MTEDEDRFEHWLFVMDDAIDRFVRSLPEDVGSRLDFSRESLTVLEAWLLSTYRGPDESRAESQAKVGDGAARYVGETLRSNLGGKWFIDFSDPKKAYYGVPQLKGLPGQGVQIAPLALVFTSIDRRTGSFLDGIYGRHARP